MSALKTVYPSVGFYFQVKLENETYSFKEVSGISSEVNTDEISEGGENRFKHKVPTGVKYDNLELKRGLVPKDSNLIIWIDNMMNSRLDNPMITKTMEISLINKEGYKVMSWSFFGVWPVAWNSSSLNSLNNEVLVESISFSYNYFTTKIIK